MDDVDRAIKDCFPEENPFAFTFDDAFAYWQAAVDHLDRLLQGKRKAELKGQPWRGWTGEGVHDASATLGRIRAVEMLVPELAPLWHVGRHGEYASQLKIAEMCASDEVEAKWKNKVLLGALATGEMDAVMAAADKDSSKK
jgi:hypothetical protein